MRILRLIGSVLLCIYLLITIPVYAQEDPSCPGTPIPRLVVGAEARVLPGDPNNVRDTASRDGALVGEIPGGESFTVLDGPVCADGFNWWHIEYNGLAGWTVEGSGSEYWVEPFATVAIAASSDPAEATAGETGFGFQPPIPAINVLEVGAQARIINDDPDSETIALTIRAEPGRNGAPVAQAIEGDLLEIIGGPEIADDMRWWQVQTLAGTQGWIIEGLTNPNRDNAYERTMLAICPAVGERIVYQVTDYVVTSAPDGTEICVLDYLRFPAWQAFSHFGFRFDRHFLISPNQEYTLYTEQLMQNDSRPFPTLYRLALDGSERLALTRGIDLNWAAWSPNGQQIAVTSGRQIGIMDADGSAYYGVVESDTSDLWVDWLLDGESIIYAQFERQNDQPGYGFYEIGLRGGEPRLIYFMPFSANKPVVLSPDRSLIAFLVISQQEGGELTAIIVDTETGQPVIEHEVDYGDFVWTHDSNALIATSYDGFLEMLSVNDDDTPSIELNGDFPPVPDWKLLGWDSPSTFLVSALSSIGAEFEAADFGIWQINTETGQVNRYP